MAQYLTYEEYVALGGEMDEAGFPLAELKARKRVDALTQGRVAAMAARLEAASEEVALPEEVKAAMMEIIAVDAALGASAQADEPPVESFSTDGYSESYGGAGSRTATAEGQLARTLGRLLYGVRDDLGEPLIYAGVSCG